MRHFSPLGTQTVDYTYGDITEGQMPDQVYSVKWNGEEKLSYTYDPLGRFSTRTLHVTGNVESIPQLTTQYSYVNVGEDRTTTLVKTINNSGLGEIGYTYDAVGNITQITKDGAVQESYTYDSLNQLKTVTRGGVTTEYSYQNGNITSVTQNGETVKTYGYTDSTWSDLLTSFNGQTITYDEIGNPLQYRDGMSFTWDKGRQLQSVTKNGVTTSYTYDENGLRLSKTTGGVTTKIYRTNGQMVGMNSSDGKDLMFLLDGSGNVYGLHYDHYSSEAQTAAATYYFAYNAQGDVIGIYDAAGTVVATYAYDEWGNCTVQVLAADSNGHAADSPDHIAQVNPFRYRGYYYDNETGFYYVSSRYYDPEVGRYLNADSVIAGVGGSIQGYNMFAYCFNNPVNMSDSSGHWPQWIKDAANWVNNNIVQPVANFFSPKTNTISGQFQDGIFRGSGSLTGGYSEFNGRLQINSKDSKNNGMLGGYGKVSVGNASGKIGIGNDNAALSVKGVGDALTATAQAGIQYKNGAGLAAKAKAAVLSGRATAELELFGWQIEFGVSGDLLSVGAEAMIGVFPDEGFTAKASVGAGLFGGGFVFRVKPKQ